MSERLSPIHPGEHLKLDFLNPLGIGTDQLAEEIGAPFLEIVLVVNGVLPITAELASKLATRFDTSEGLWLKLQSQYESALEADSKL